jgi:hypothetical protein
MANIRKSFNFRNGVQVDNDNFVVNANGLVGIGTSVPQTYLLNVYGDTRTTGLTTTRDLYAQNVEISGISTVGFITATTSYIGILTVSQIKVGNSDIVDNLIGYARTTFITDNGGVGLHTTSKLGINTTTSPGASDPEFSVFGNVDVTGIITATTFSGNVTGNVNSGISTFTELKVGTAITMSAGIVTATSFVGNLTGDVTGDVTGNITGTATTATNLSDGANITAGTISDARLPDLITSNINASSGVSTFTELKVGTAITMSAGIVTATTFEGALNSTNLTGTIDNDRLPVTPQFTSIGIGTASPANTFQQRETGATELQITSDTSSASITVGREPGTSNTNNAEFRYGGGGGFALSNAQSLDIVNYGTGNFNYYLSANNAGAAAGDYVWHKGANNSQLMSLTKDGNLGIGITNPSHKLDVQGISTFTGNAHFESNVTIDGNLTVNLGGTFSVSGLVSATSFQGDLLAPDGLATIIDTGTGNGSNGLSFVNTNVTAGVSTFYSIRQSDGAYVAFATTDIQGVDAIGGNAPTFIVNPPTLAGGSGSPRVVVTQKGCIGSGTTNPQCALDLGSATANDDAVAYSSDRFMILPKVSTTNRGNLSNLTAGAVIYNTSLNKIQVYTGSGWETVTSS